jgi:hypothetical protein
MATQVYKRGGWTMVSNAFTRLPLSSEQILHPEKYFNYERPIKITLPDVANLLNSRAGAVAGNQAASAQQSAESAAASPAPGPTKVSGRRTSVRSLPSKNSPPAARSPLQPSAWRHIDSDVNGEWGYYLILDQFLSSLAESRRAAAGWLAIAMSFTRDPEVRCCGPTRCWDTENDAREFFDAYVKRTQLRYPGRSDWTCRIQKSKLKTQNQKLELVIHGPPAKAECSGTARVAGYDPRGPSGRRRCRFVPQGIVAMTEKVEQSCLPPRTHNCAETFAVVI